MDHREALHAHVAWYADLSDRLAKGETVDAEEVARDDLCEMGRWLLAEGVAHADLPEFQEFKKVHADYHKCAADAVRMSNAGETEQAIMNLQVDGPCMALSDDLLEKHYLLVRKIQETEEEEEEA